MRKLALLSFIALFCSVSAWAAPDRVNRVDWGVHGGGAFNDNVDDTGYVATNLSYGVNPWIGVGVEGGWQESDGTDVEEVGNAWILGDILVRWPDHPWKSIENLCPYMVVGLGGGWTYVVNEPSTATQDGDDDDDSGFMWKIGTGFDWFLDSNWVVNFEVAWYDGDDMALPGSSVDADDQSFFTVGAGIKYVF